ncbi:hypothetical protein ACFY9F_22875 [Streptomyces sp. NPDC012421]|uniref:hypothetical protein n=1 Tax=Streptomyces sp. NPDC012421 TaxID=3364832 RepID=UPI0036E53656
MGVITVTRRPDAPAFTGVGAATGEDEIQGGFTARDELGSGSWQGASVSHRGDWTGTAGRT